jgi:glutamyl-tRNA synthetase
MSESEIESIREQQTKTKITPGIYGNFSLRRNKTPDEIKAQIESNPNYIIRFRSHGDITKRVVFDDLSRGKMSMIDNYNDIILIKSDGLPTYHLAHISDDHLMRTTHVIRGEEWLTSVPLHLQLFAAFGITPPLYCHLAPLLKTEDGNKRKLSKRKDPEANMQFFSENGYAKQ